MTDRDITRRDLVRYALIGGAGMLLANRFVQAAVPAIGGATRPSPATRAGGKAGATARSVIQIWMWGGPCHIDTFDPKPEAGSDYTGQLAKAIETNVSGIRINESLPLLAKQADKFAIIRSMTHGINAHETASYAVQTGRMPGGTLVYPGAGAVISLFKGYDAGYHGLIPPYVVLTQPQGRFSEAGFLGSRCKPFATGGDPNQQRFVVEGVIAPGISDQRQKARRDLLHNLNTLNSSMDGDARLTASQESEKQAYDLILGDGAKVFDLSQETSELRERYGRSTFGQSCLMARRLVEKGVPYITINYQGWDTHKQHFPTMRQKLPEMDRAMSALLDDLSSRGLLDSTIVWWGGEFGRTPKVQWEAPWNGGRGHWGQAFSTVVAGGGFKGGRVVGATGPRGEEVKDRPVYPVDIIASIYELMGIDLNGNLPTPQGTTVPIWPAASEGVKSGGRLSEIM